MQPPSDTEHGGFLKHMTALRSRTGSVGLQAKLKVRKIIWVRIKLHSLAGFPPKRHSHYSERISKRPNVAPSTGPVTHDLPGVYVDIFIGKCENKHMPFWSISPWRFTSPCQTQRFGFRSLCLFRPALCHLRWVARAKWQFLWRELSLNAECCLPKMTLNVLPRTQ